MGGNARAGIPLQLNGEHTWQSLDALTFEGGALLITLFTLQGNDPSMTAHDQPFSVFRCTPQLQAGKGSFKPEAALSIAYSVLVQHFALRVFLKAILQPLREGHFNGDGVEGLVASVAVLAAFLDNLLVHEHATQDTLQDLRFVAGLELVVHL